MSSIAKRSHRSRTQWQALIARAEDSELSVTEFCRRESVSTASFYTWRNRLRGDIDADSTQNGHRFRGEGSHSAQVKRTVGGEFIDLGTLGDTGSNAGPWLIELDLGAGMVLRLRRG